MESIKFNLETQTVQIPVYFLKELACAHIDEQVRTYGYIPPRQVIESLRWSEADLEAGLDQIGINMEDLQLDPPSYGRLQLIYSQLFEGYKKAIVNELIKRNNQNQLLN